MGHYSVLPGRITDAVLVTQVSVERLFSPIKLLMTDLQFCSKSEVNEAMLLLWSNLKLKLGLRG